MCFACNQPNTGAESKEHKEKIEANAASTDSSTSKKSFSTDAGPASSSGKSVGRPGAHVPGVPDKAYQTASYVDQYHRAPTGYVGGREFENREHRLPERDAAGNIVSYQEYDVNPKQNGVNRGVERIIISNRGQHYYTADHYKHFISF